MSYNADSPADITVSEGIRENFRALKEDKIVAAASAVIADSATKLTNVHTINGVAFDGTADITITNGVPIGSIVMWSGSVDTIPTNWALCNGQNGTPDLRDKFVLGAGNSYAVGATGGEAIHKLTVEEMPSHSHNVKFRAYGAAGSNGWDGAIDSDVTDTNLTTNTGGNKPHNNMPPYYVLAYIMRIA